MDIREKFLDTLHDALLDERLLFIDAARRLAVLEDLVERLDKSPEMLEDEEMAYLLRFETPLDILADRAQEQISDEVDLYDVLEEVLNDDYLATTYEMLPEPEEQETP